jgi:hypothetical protein
LIEQLAHYEHESWARWMQYLFSKCIRDEDDDYVIPRALVERWQRQADTPYAELSEQEKESDREEVRRILPIIQEMQMRENLTYSA